MQSPQQEIRALKANSLRAILSNPTSPEGYLERARLALARGEPEAIYYFRAAYLRGDRSQDTRLCLGLALEAVGWVSLAEKMRGKRPPKLTPVLMRFEEKIWVSVDAVYECLQRPIASGPRPAIAARDIELLKPEMSKRFTQPLKPPQRREERPVSHPPSGDGGRKLPRSMMPSLPKVANPSIRERDVPIQPARRGNSDTFPKLPNRSVDVLPQHLRGAEKVPTHRPQAASAPPAPLGMPVPEAPTFKPTPISEPPRAALQAAPTPSSGVGAARRAEAFDEALAEAAARAELESLEMRADSLRQRIEAPSPSSKASEEEEPRATYHAWGRLQRALGGSGGARPPRQGRPSAKRRYLIRSVGAFSLPFEAIKPYLDCGEIPLDPPLPAEHLGEEIMVRVTRDEEHLWIKAECRGGLESLGAECDQLHLCLTPDLRVWLSAAQ